MHNLSFVLAKHIEGTVTFVGPVNSTSATWQITFTFLFPCAFFTLSSLQDTSIPDSVHPFQCPLIYVTLPLALQERHALPITPVFLCSKMRNLIRMSVTSQR